MKKLVTLSAIAMAGATLGVGTTFGWWADPVETEGEKGKIQATDPTANEVAPGELNDVLITNPNAIDFKSVQSVEYVPAGSLTPVPANVAATLEVTPSPPRFEAAHVVLAESPSAAFDKLADQLESEARELDQQGQKDVAEAKRKVAERLRDTVKAIRPQLILRQPTLAGNVQVNSNPNDASAREMQHQVHHHMKAEILRGEPVLHEKAEAEIRALSARIKHLEAMVGGKKHGGNVTFYNAPADVYGETKDIAHGHVHDGKKGQQTPAVEELVEIAARLEKYGHREQAREIRRHADEVARTIQHDVSIDQKRQTEERHRDGFQPVGNPHEAEHRKVIIREVHGDDVAYVVREGKDVHQEGEHHIQVGSGQRFRIERSHVEEAPLMDVQRALKELRHEIKELRADVHKLRDLLKSANELDEEEHDGDKHSKRDAEQDDDDKVKTARDEEDDKEDGKRELKVRFFKRAEEDREGRGEESGKRKSDDDKHGKTEAKHKSKGKASHEEEEEDDQPHDDADGGANDEGDDDETAELKGEVKLYSELMGASR